MKTAEAAPVGSTEKLGPVREGDGDDIDTIALDGGSLQQPVPAPKAIGPHCTRSHFQPETATLRQMIEGRPTVAATDTERIYFNLPVGAHNRAADAVSLQKLPGLRFLHSNAELGGDLDRLRHRCQVCPAGRVNSSGCGLLGGSRLALCCPRQAGRDHHDGQDFHSLALTNRLTYRRRAERLSAQKIIDLIQSCEREVRAAVRWSRFVRLSLDNIAANF